MRRPPRDAPSRGDWALGKLIMAMEHFSRICEPEPLPHVMRVNPSDALSRRRQALGALITAAEPAVVEVSRTPIPTSRDEKASSRCPEPGRLGSG